MTCTSCNKDIEADDRFEYDDGEYEVTIEVCSDCFDREAKAVVDAYHGRGELNWTS